MFRTPFLRRQMLELVQQHLLPWAGGRSASENGGGELGGGSRKHLLLLQPPLHLPPDVKVVDRIVEAAQMRRGKPTPGKGSFTSHVLWPQLAMHTIPFAWMGFLFQGEADLRIGANRSLVCGPGGEGKIHIVSMRAPTFFVIPPGIPHPDGSRIPWERPLHLLGHDQEMFWMHVSPAGLRCHISRVVGQHYHEEFFLLLKDEALTTLARLLLGEMQRPQRFDLIVEATVLSLLLQLEKVLSEGLAANGSEEHPDHDTSAADNQVLGGRIGQESHVAPGASRVVLEAALRFIETHLNWRILSLEMVAGHVYVSPSHLSRVFKAELNMTVKEYIQSSRMELAKSLLEESDMAVAEVGFLTGFFPPSHFTRAFSHEVGVSPRKYRDSHRKGTLIEALPLPNQSKRGKVGAT